MENAAKEKLASKLANLRTITKRLVADYNQASQLISLLNFANADEALHSAVDKTYEANGLNIVVNSLIHLEVSILSRMYDTVAPNKSRPSNRASIRHAMIILDERDVEDALIEEARKWNPGILRLEERNAATARQKLEEARGKFRNLTSDPSETEKLDQLKRFRDHYIGHSLFNTSKQIKLLYGYVGDIYLATGAILEPLRLGVLGEAWDHSDVSDINDNMASRFWSAFAAGVKARKLGGFENLFEE